MRCDVLWELFSPSAGISVFPASRAAGPVLVVALVDLLKIEHVLEMDIDIEIPDMRHGVRNTARRVPMRDVSHGRAQRTFWIDVKTSLACFPACLLLLMLT